jgi:hypothetical protein
VRNFPLTAEHAENAEIKLSILSELCDLCGEDIYGGKDSDESANSA